VHVVADIIVVGWVVFWVGWLIAAAGAKRGHIKWGPIVWTRVAIALVVVLLIRVKVFKGQTIIHDPWLQAIGLVMFVSGLALAVWARLNLGSNWGSPMSEKKDLQLVTTGPYRRIRHPIYSGIILGFVGTALAINWHWLIVAALAGAYFVYSAFIEERYLAQRLPDTYPAYKRGTRMLIPFVL
jgi:protein-S-isoprenylcysteine O-methyltransferase Ste14